MTPTYLIVASVSRGTGHVPTDTEWGTLIAYVGADSARIKLSSIGWSSGNGTDAYGFNVLPAGFRLYDVSFTSLGSTADFWSSSKNDWAWYRYFYFGYPYVARSDKGVEYGFSLRCLEN